MSELHTLLVYLMQTRYLIDLAKKSEKPIPDESPGGAYWRMGHKVYRTFAPWVPLRLTVAFTNNRSCMALVVGRPKQEFSSLSEATQQRFLKFFREEPSRFTLLVPEKLVTYPQYSYPRPDGSGDDVVQIGSTIKSNLAVRGLWFPEEPENEPAKEIKRSKHAAVEGSKTALVYWASRDDWAACARSSEFPFAQSPTYSASFNMCCEAFYRLAPLGRVSMAVLCIENVKGLALVVGRHNQDLWPLSAEMQHELLGLFGAEPRRLTWVPGRRRHEYFSLKSDGSGEELVRLIDATPDWLPSYATRMNAFAAAAPVTSRDSTNKEET